MASPTAGIAAERQRQKDEAEQQRQDALSAPDPFVLQAMDQAAAEIDAEKTQQSQATVDSRGGGVEGALGRVDDFLGAVGMGPANALLQAKDAIMGGSPNYEDKSQFRKDTEAATAEFARRSSVNAIGDGIARFVTGIALSPNKAGALKDAGKTGTLAYETARGAIIGAAVFDPQQERLSDLVEQYPALSNPVTQFLSASPDDSDAEGRLKNALEGIGMDLALVGVFSLGLKAYRYAKAGNKQAAEDAGRQAEEALAQYQEQRASQSSSLTAEAARQQPGVTQQPRTVRQPGQTSGVTPPGPRRPEGAQPIVEPSQGASDVAAGSLRDQFAQGPEGAPRAAPDVAPTDLRAGFAKGPDAPPGPPVGASDVAPGSARDQFAQGPMVRQGMPEEAAPKTPKAPAPLPDQTVDKLVELSDVARRYGDYGNPEEFRGVAPGGYINWTKVGGAPDVQTYTQAVAKQIEPRLRKIAGDVLSDAKVNAMVQARAAAFGEDPQALVAMIRQQGKNATTMVADMEASYVTASAILQDVYKLASKIKLGMLDEFGGDPAAAKAELARQMAIGAEVLGSARAMTANAGRSLRRMRNEFKITPETVKMFEGNTDALVEAVYQSKGDPKLLGRALDPSFMSRAENVFSHLITNGPLWFWPTHVVNGISNAYMLAARPTERVLGSLFLGSSGKAVRRQALKEYRYTVTAAMDGWQAGKDAWLSGDSALAPHSGITEDLGASGKKLDWVPVKDVTDLAHNALLFANWRVATGIPTRFMGLVDEAVKTMRYRAVVSARAAADAEDMGLSGGAAESYIAQRLDAAFDDMGRTSDAEALRESLAATMQTPLKKGTFGFGLQSLVQNQPILRAVFTYVRTPINLLRYGIRMTPGLQFAQREFREMLTSPDPGIKAQAYGQMMLGGLWLAAVSPFVVAGSITGGGPRDPKLRAELIAQGWRPYSYVYDDGEGNKTYYPIGRLDPAGLPIGMMADLWDMYKHPDTHGLQESENSLQQIEAGMQAVFVALLKNITNKTYLMQLDSAVKALNEPDKQGARFLGNIAENTIPGSAALRGFNPDEYSREARSIVDNIIDTMPGLSTTLEPRFDALSAPVIVQRGLWASNTYPGDKLRQEMQRLILETGKGVTPVDPKRDSNVDLRDFPLANGRSAYARLNELTAQPKSGPSLVKSLEKLVSSKEYQKAPDGDGEAPGTKLWMMKKIITSYRTAAYASLLRENPELAKAVTENKRKAAAAYRKTQTDQKAGASQVDNTLRALGVQQ